MGKERRAAKLKSPELQDLATSDQEIVANNIRALQPAYFAAMFEEMKAFQVVDKLVELFQNGLLPIGRGRAGRNLFKYWQESALRISEAERLSFYARAFGFAGGDDSGKPNREFNDLWMRFVSSVASLARQNNVDVLLQAGASPAISGQQVREAGRDVAANLSLHGVGWAYFIATELQKQINDVIKLLSESEIKSAYGARDMWQVIDEVAATELGGSRDSVRYRTMAMSGATIISWLAKNSRKLSSSAPGPILDPDASRKPASPQTSSKPTRKSTDSDLINACEQWLAAAGIPDDQVKDYGEPTETPHPSATLT